MNADDAPSSSAAVAVTSAVTSSDEVKSSSTEAAGTKPVSDAPPVVVSSASSMEIVQETTTATTTANDNVKKEDSSLSVEVVKSETMDAAASVKGENNNDAAAAAADADVDDNDDNDVESIKSEGAEEEDALFTTLEQEEEQEEAIHPHSQPDDAAAAPMLLQQAIQQGQVKEDSDTETTTANKKSTLKSDDDDDGKMEESDEKKTANGDEGEHPHHHHQRQNQLDFLLSKASEYSSFISKDLEELQESMAKKAQEKADKSEKRKKRKGGSDGGKSSSSKKKSKGNSGQALKAALVGDAKQRATGNKAIFIQPPNLADGCYLKDYQLEGVRWMTSLFENGVSGILADEMGLGKTIQVIGLVAHLLTQDVRGCFLVVAPLATLPNWVREFQKWLPSKPVIRYHGSAQDREAMLRGPLNPKEARKDGFPVVITSFETAIRDQKKLGRIGKFAYVIVDEGHRLKNHRCMLIRSLKTLSTENRLLLTGTPIQNTLDELWSLLNFVNPQIFDDLSVFQSWFGFKDIGQKTHNASTEEDIVLEERKNQTVTKLHEILRPFLLRRVKKDVLSEMPPKKEIVVYSGMSKLQLGYQTLIEKGVLRDELLRQGIEEGRTLSQTNRMMNHRKNVNHPFMFGEPKDPNTGLHIGTTYPQLLIRASGKFALMDRMLDRLHKDGHQVLIFSQMTKVLNIIEDYLNFRKWKYCRIDGQTNIDDRQKAMDVFNAEKTGGADGKRNLADDRYFVFMLSTRAGGLGINLTSADTCIIFDSDWNPHADSQAMDRCHRLGQTRPVAVYRLLTCNSVDIEMLEKQVSKKKLERMTITGGDFRKAGVRSQGDLSFEKLQELLQNDVQDMQGKGQDVEDIKISDEEFDMIMDRKRLFQDGSGSVPTEGKMYDIIAPGEASGLGAMS